MFENYVTLPVWVWEQHASQHEFDDIPASEEHIYQTVVDPDQAHRNLDPSVIGESCIFVKYFADAQHHFLVPVLYDGINEPDEYEKGGKKGRVLTGYFRSSPCLSSSMGPIFWSKMENKDEGDEK